MWPLVLAPSYLLLTNPVCCPAVCAAGLWQSRQLFVSTPTSVHVAFADPVTSFVQEVQASGLGWVWHGETRSKACLCIELATACVPDSSARMQPHEACLGRTWCFP